jgi:hypothetical protein
MQDKVMAEMLGQSHGIAVAILVRVAQLGADLF